MPFNSNYNSLKDTGNSEESFAALRNNYNVPSDGYSILLQPELMYRPTNRVNQEYIPAGRTTQQTQYNTDELRRLDDEVLQGEGVGRFFKKAAKKVKKAAHAADKATRPAQAVVKREAIKSGDAIKKSTMNKDGLIRKGISAAADRVIPELGAALGTAIGTAMGNPQLGAMAGEKLGNMAREKLDEETGYGIGKYKKVVGKAAKKAAKAVKEVDLEKVVNKYAADYSKEVRKMANNQKLGDVHLEGGRAVNKRNEIVKRIMKEKGLSLPEASKYVKNNNLY